MTTEDPHNLQRFISAQAQDYDTAIEELKAGQKQSHWIWYVFPQVAGLGFSDMAERYSIKDRAEAIAYIEHDILGPRLIESAETLLQIEGRRIEDIMGYPDDMKLRSSMTLFHLVTPPDSVFQKVLDRYFGGFIDGKTVAYLNQE